MYFDIMIQLLKVDYGLFRTVRSHNPASYYHYKTNNAQMYMDNCINLL